VKRRTEGGVLVEAIDNKHNPNAGEGNCTGEKAVQDTTAAGEEEKCGGWRSVEREESSVI
jgi:uncharacterized low-complexity protein